MLGRRRREDPVREVFADFVVAAQLGQQRLQRVVGEDHTWHLDLDAGVVQVGDLRCPVDVVGTASGRSWLWAWANPTFAGEQVLTAALLRRVGLDWGIDALASGEELALDRVDPHLAGTVGAGTGEADAYYAGHHADGAVVFLLRHRRLHTEPFRAADVTPVLTQLVAGDLEVDARDALEAFAGDPPAGVAVRRDGGVVTVAVADGTFTVRLGRRVTFEAELSPAGAPAPAAPATAPAPALREVGTLELPAGPVAVLDPLLAVDALFTEPRPGALPAGVHRVGVALDVEDGDERVACAALVLADAAPVRWRPVGHVLTDSGVLAFATPEAAARLADGGEDAAQAVEEALAASARGTWQHAALDGLVAVTAGHGAGEYALRWGYDAEDRLVRVAVDVLPEPPLAAPDVQPRPPAEHPAPGHERALLLPVVAGGAVAAENAVPLPAAMHRRLTAAHRRMLRLTFGGADVEGSVLPEYDGDAVVPSRIVVRADAGASSFTETIEPGKIS